jgi:hypothetical protein
MREELNHHPSGIPTLGNYVDQGGCDNLPHSRHPILQE